MDMFLKMNLWAWLDSIQTSESRVPGTKRCLHDVCLMLFTDLIFFSLKLENVSETSG